MSVLRNLFSHQKHHVQKVCISHDDSGAPVEFHGVVDIDDRNHHQAKGDNNLFVACDKKGKKTKNKFSKKKRNIMQTLVVLMRDFVTVMLRISTDLILTQNLTLLSLKIWMIINTKD